MINIQANPKYPKIRKIDDKNQIAAYICKIQSALSFI